MKTNIKVKGTHYIYTENWIEGIINDRFTQIHSLGIRVRVQQEKTCVVKSKIGP